MTSPLQDSQWLIGSNAVYPAVPAEPMPLSRLTCSKGAYLTRVARGWLATDERLSASQEYSIRELLSLLLDPQSP